MAEKRKTKKQRVAEKVAAGLSHIEAEIEVEQEDSRKRVSKLKAQAAAEQRKVDGVVLELLKKEQAEAYATLERKARKQLREETALRGRRARAAAVAAAPQAPAMAQGQSTPAAPSAPQLGHPGQGLRQQP